jgi:hypothetical protein
VPNAIEQLTVSGLTVGHAGFGLRGSASAPGTAKQEVHDGDTVTVRALGNFGVRFLGIDAAEKSFPLPGGDAFISIDDARGRWATFLEDPFAGSLPPFKPALKANLLAYLRERVGPETAANHARHAEQARQALIAEVLADMQELGKTKDDFAFFLAFANEVTDGYGRLLAYLNRDQPKQDASTPRPLSYNERLLDGARVTPYFIWPNVDPFRKISALVDAVPKPGAAPKIADRAPSLRRAREQIRQARAQQHGIFDAADPLRLYPFELRFLARRQPPTRWLIDLSASDDRIIPPQKYHTVPHPEDRLWLPDEYIALWVEQGWRRGR